MRWTREPKWYPSENDSRIIKRFLFFPKTLNDETRWLEWAAISQTYYVDWYETPPFWDSKCWVDSVDIHKTIFPINQPIEG